MKCLMIDDHPIVVDGLRAVLPPNVTIAHHATDAESGLQWLKDHSVDWVILDLMMPGIGGQEAVRRLRRHHPKISILVFSAHCATPICSWLLEQGVMALVDKNASPQELQTAFSQIARGQRYLSHGLAQSQVLGSLSGDGLSEREFQVIQMLLQGQKPAEISANLFISPKTVSTYRQRAMTRLGLNSDVELFQYALSQGWIGSAAAH